MALMRHRYLLAFLSAAGILALVGVAIMLGTHRYRQDARMVAHTLEVISVNERVHAEVLRAVAAQRSYVLTGDLDYRDLFYSAREGALVQAPVLVKLVSDNPGQSARAAELDQHGHDGGDALLAAFGQLLLASCRGEDIPCRYGGEEFTLILTEILPEDALLRAEELRAAVSRMAIRHLQRDISGVTASIGLAMFPQDAQDTAGLQRKADLALYRAKHSGRNRVETAGTTDVERTAPV